jgi:A/G-specific adenine glycosylase
MVHFPGADFTRLLHRKLLSWFRKARRPLPWRQDRNPYRIWVSEIMLQQTQVAAVIPYFERFLKAFPTLDWLAAADEQEVLQLWEGLGYYRRARDLHKAAQILVREQRGAIPDDPAIIAALPGIGRYTLGAILSQAFDRPLPILEANSQRVLCRLLGVQEDPSAGRARRLLWQAAEAMLPAKHCGDFNQALMELGSLVCTPVAPRCDACPVAALCAARLQGLQHRIPLLAKPRKPVDIAESAVIVQRGLRVLLVQRPDQGRWGGLWEFPHAPLNKRESYEECAERLVTELTGLRAAVTGELLSLRHGVTHQRITLVCFEARFCAGRFSSRFYRQGRWVRPAELPDFPVSSPQRRLARALLQPSRQRTLF